MLVKALLQRTKKKRVSDKRGKGRDKAEEKEEGAVYKMTLGFAALHYYVMRGKTLWLQAACFGDVYDQATLDPFSFTHTLTT